MVDTEAAADMAAVGTEAADTEAAVMGYPGGGYRRDGYAQGYGQPQQRYTQTPFGAAADRSAGARRPEADRSDRNLSGARRRWQPIPREPRIIPNQFDNTILVQGTPQEWEQIKKLLEQIDIPPRQVLIEAKIYSVDSDGAFAGGVNSGFQAASCAPDSQRFLPQPGRERPSAWRAPAGLRSPPERWWAAIASCSLLLPRRNPATGRKSSRRPA